MIFLDKPGNRIGGFHFIRLGGAPLMLIQRAAGSYGLADGAPLLLNVTL